MTHDRLRGVGDVARSRRGPTDAAAAAARSDRGPQPLAAGLRAAAPGPGGDDLPGRDRPDRVFAPSSRPSSPSSPGTGPTSSTRHRPERRRPPGRPDGSSCSAPTTSGRDLLVRIAYGARISLLVGVRGHRAHRGHDGAIVGLLAGYFGGIVDTVLARIIDVMLAIPFLLFAISLASLRGAPELRAGRSADRDRRDRLQLVVVGADRARPGARDQGEGVHRGGAVAGRLAVADHVRRRPAERDGPVIVYATLLIPLSIVAEASLSYLGVGVPPPTADWGAMIADARLLPGGAGGSCCSRSLALLITTLAFNILGDGIRDAFDPRGDRVYVRSLAMIRFLVRRIAAGHLGPRAGDVHRVFLIFFVGPGPDYVARTFAGRRATPAQVALIEHGCCWTSRGTCSTGTWRGTCCTATSATTTTTASRSTRHRPGLPDHALARHRRRDDLAHLRRALRGRLGGPAAVAPRPALHHVALFFYSMPTFVLGLLLSGSSPTS